MHHQIYIVLDHINTDASCSKQKYLLKSFYMYILLMIVMHRQTIKYLSLMTSENDALPNVNLSLIETKLVLILASLVMSMNEEHLNEPEAQRISE